VKDTRRRLGVAEVERAIFFDYEGNTKRPPTLLGWRVNGGNHAAIFEAAFATCADRYRAKCVVLQDHAQLARQLIELAEREDRLLVSWSEHDLGVMRAVLDPSWYERLLARYRNALRTVRPWHRTTIGPLDQPATLAYFSELVGFTVPERYGLGIVGEGLILLRKQLEEGRSYPALTPRARAAWVAIVKHNQHDLEATEFVLRVVLADRHGGPKDGEHSAGGRRQANRPDGPRLRSSRLPASSSQRTVPQHTN
jgi:hypothetical protein